MSDEQKTASEWAKILQKEAMDCTYPEGGADDSEMFLDMTAASSIIRRIQNATLERAAKVVDKHGKHPAEGASRAAIEIRTLKEPPS